MKASHIESFNRLQDIEKAIAAIRKYSQSETCTSFCKKEIVHDAILFQFSVIGEAVIHIENEKLEKYNYPWYKVRSFRNMIAHEYFNIKLIAVWQIIESDLPILEDVVKSMIKNEF